MKKTYINPQLEVIKIATQQMQAASTLGLDNSSGNALDSGDILSRKSDFDEDF